MKQSFLKDLKNVQTITIRDLQGKIKDSNKLRGSDQHSPHSPQNQTCSDLNIISPFYERTTHKPDCTCKYHKRQRAMIPKVKKIRTEPNEAVLPNIRASIPAQIEQQAQPSKVMERQFEDWRAELSSEDLKRYYFQYLKNLPNFDKVKRLDKLDCHNIAFEEFLKNNYLVILQRQKREEKDKAKENEPSSRIYKSSQKMLHKVYTEGNIDYQTPSDFSYKKEGFSYKDTSKMDTLMSVREDGGRLKKIGMKSTGKTLQFIDEEQIKSRKEDNRRKKAKFLNSRPSFFGLIEDQELLRSLCMKLMNQNKRVNKQAEVIVKQLVESDIQMYQKMIGQIEEDLQAGIKLRNLNKDEASMLIKIVLNKIQKQTQMTKSKDVHYEHKNSLIDDLCNKYGWPKDDKIMELKEFWKMRQEKQNSNFSRSSFLNINTHVSKGRISRNNIDSKENKKIKSKIKIKDQNRMSGFQSEKSPNKVQNSVKFVDVEQSSNSTIQISKPQEFKFINSKPITKMGIFNKKQKAKNSNFYTENEPKGTQNNRKTFGTSFKTYPKEVAFELQEIDDVVIEFQTSKSIKQQAPSLQSQSRNSSMYLNLKNQVQRHIQLNKRFLKRIQHNLIDNECERLIIGMGEGIITKKRKIRAIYEALETEKIKQSDYYNDILKYLQIYEGYCDLVVKNKREKKAKPEQQQIAIPSTATPEQVIQKRLDEDELDICLLLDSLKNQRELKFIDLNLLKEEEDPREELILKIPQYITKVEPRRKQKKQITDRGSVDSNRSNSSSHKRYQCGILQKDLGETVTVECSNNWTPPELETAYPSEPIPQNIIDFENKMQRFRYALRLSAQKP